MAQDDYLYKLLSRESDQEKVNRFLAAIVSNNSGATAPTTTYAYQWWADTTTGLLKIRNAANSAWITVGTLGSAYLGNLTSADIGVSIQAYDADIPTVSASQAEMEAGTESALRSMSPLRVAQAIAALGGNASITLGTPRATTSGTSIDFTGIPSGTKMIVISMTGVSTNGTSIPIIQLGDSGGVETSGYVGGNFNATTGAANIYTTATNGLNLTAATAAVDALKAQVILTKQSSSSNTWLMSGSGSIGNTCYFYTVTKALSAELDSVRLTTAGGANTFDAGEINILYFG